MLYGCAHETNQYASQRQMHKIEVIECTGQNSTLKVKAKVVKTATSNIAFANIRIINNSDDIVTIDPQNIYLISSTQGQINTISVENLRNTMKVELSNDISKCTTLPPQWAKICLIRVQKEYTQLFQIIENKAMRKTDIIEHSFVLKTVFYKINSSMYNLHINKIFIAKIIAGKNNNMSLRLECTPPLIYEQ